MLGAWPDRGDAQHRRLQARCGGTDQPVVGAGLIRPSPWQIFASVNRYGPAGYSGFRRVCALGLSYWLGCDHPEPQAQGAHGCRTQIWRARYLHQVRRACSQGCPRAYLRAVEELSGCKLALVATGADREDTIVLDDPSA